MTAGGPRRQPYQPQLVQHGDALEQSFHANYVVAQDQGSGWLFAFGDLCGDEALGDMRSAIHSLMVYVERPSDETPRYTICIELNDQANAREGKEVERMVLARNEVSLRMRPGSELWSGRVAYTPDIDPHIPNEDPEPRTIRGLRVTFSCDDPTYETLAKVMRETGFEWITVSPSLRP